MQYHAFKQKKAGSVIVVGDVVLRRKSKTDQNHGDSEIEGQVVVLEVRETVVGRGGHKGAKVKYRFLGATEGHDKVGDVYSKDVIGHINDKQLMKEAREAAAKIAKAKKEQDTKDKAEAGNLPIDLYQYLKREEPFGCNTPMVIKSFRLLLAKKSGGGGKKKVVKKKR